MIKVNIELKDRSWNKKVKIPTTDEISTKVGELSTKFQNEINDPSFQKKYEKGINFLNTFGNQISK